MTKTLNCCIKNGIEYESGIYLNEYDKYEIFYEMTTEDSTQYKEGSYLLQQLGCRNWPKWEHNTYEEALQEYNKYEDEYVQYLH